MARSIVSNAWEEAAGFRGRRFGVARRAAGLVLVGGVRMRFAMGG